MNLEPLEPDHAGVVALLQPYVDGELSDEERELVAEQVATNPEYEALICEQREVRSLLRGLERELAPEGLRARILADLDVVEAERREAEQRGWFAPVVGRIKAFGKGAMLMVPAVAAAGALFFVANNAGWIDGPAGASHIDGGMASSLRVTPTLEPHPHPRPGLEAGGVEPVAAQAEAGPGLPSAKELAEQEGFVVQVAPPRSLPSGVALVSDSERAPSSTATVRYRASDGAVMVDLQRRAGVALMRGESVSFRARDYALGRDALGRAIVEFEHGGVHHSLLLEAEPSGPDAGVGVELPEFARLLIVADALRDSR